MPRPIRIVSFGYLHQPPPSTAHLSVDLRTHFRDPHPDPGFSHLSFPHPRVREKVLATPGIPPLIDALTAAAAAMAAGPAKADIKVAIGCAGGQHRAPTVAHEVTERLREQGLLAALAHLHLGRPVVKR